MKVSRIGRRVAGSAAAALMIGATALAVAPTASAKAYSLSAGKVALKKPGVEVDVTYSCDAGSKDWLVAGAVNVNHPWGVEGSVIVKGDKLVCDYETHKMKVFVPPIVDQQFNKGDKVEVTLVYFDSENGRRSFETKTTQVV
ncbi:hypothetical protein [Streptomyces luteireticuli]|uniref:hypothetical protein n=1 Tax=Streptomyces luteireticuli TaxID=173858 RepID=UPI003557CB92